MRISPGFLQSIIVELRKLRAICVLAIMDLWKLRTRRTPDAVELRKLNAICKAELVDLRRLRTRCKPVSVELRKLRAILFFIP